MTWEKLLEAFIFRQGSMNQHLLSISCYAVTCGGCELTSSWFKAIHQ